jgi:hypothetical protein
MYHKDGYKEALMDRLGWEDDDLLDKLGDSSFEILFRVLESNLEAGVDCIVEANFRTESRPRFLKLRKKYGATFIELNCIAEPKRLVKLLKRRIKRGNRHKGHQDEKTLALGEDGLRAAAIEHCLHLPDACIPVEAKDISDADYALLLTDLKTRFARAAEGR